MYQEPIFLQPVFQERIWGGKKLASEYGYTIPSDKTGEAWVISAHPNGASVIENGPLAGKTLKEAWEEHGELFNKQPDDQEAYPLLVKILDANDDLSVQVHPDDAFAEEIEGEPYGKTECWYVLQAEPEAKIVFGHHAETREEFESMMKQGEWERLLNYKNVQTGDFIYVPSGTIHAIGKGIVILETQQSSDITYRVYDYDRKDAAGNKRELHLEKSIEVTTVPHREQVFEHLVETIGDLTIQTLIEEKYFTVYHWDIAGIVERELDQDFLQVSVIEGSGEIAVGDKTFAIEKGSHFILPHTLESYRMSGNVELIVSHP